MRFTSYRTYIGMLLIGGLFSLYSCKSNSVDPPSEGETQDTPIKATIGKTINVNFEASGKWIASSSASWLRVLTSSGEAGSSTLQLVPISTSAEKREATVTINVGGTKTLISVYQDAASSASEIADINVNLFQDKELREVYLWNDEYAVMDKDFNKDYSSFLTDNLLSMTTNTLDQKRQSDGSRTLFSYIEKVSGSTKASSVPKESTVSYGFAGIIPVAFTDNSVMFWVGGVYPDSPASEAGIYRGVIIEKIDGVTVNMNNYIEMYYKLQLPTAGYTINITDYDGNPYSLTAASIYLNPVLHTSVAELAGRKIGYLVYDNFDAGFDQELLDAFKELSMEGVTDFVLDLRYNGGGYVVSANLIASCIAGSKSDGKVFCKYRYNDSRMKTLKDEDLITNFYYNSIPQLGGQSAAASSLNLNKIYCIVGSGTASASELVINGLRGIDVDVVLIGEQTVGKNVGMEVETKEIDGSTYRFAPITFQSYNAKEFGDYQDGFTPDYIINELGEGATVYRFRPYGSYQEILYRKALELITGLTTFPGDDDSEAETKSAGMEFTGGKILAVPQPQDPYKNNMVKLKETIQ